MTVPNLMQNYEKQVRITQIKTAYSILQNATALAVLKNGHPSTWESSQNYSTETYVTRYFIPYVKVAADCGFYSQDANRTCFKKLPKFLVEPNNETEQGVMQNYYYSVKLQNGMIVSMRHSPDGARVYFLVDVNGNRGPSKAGVDIFGFQGNFMQGKNFISTNISNDDTFNDYHEVMTTGLFKCNATTGEQNGPNCTHVLYLNGWDFPDDYPVKKF